MCHSFIYSSFMLRGGGGGGGSPSNWKSTQHFQLLFSPFELFLFDGSLILCDRPRLCDWLRLHLGCVIPLHLLVFRFTSLMLAMLGRCRSGAEARSHLEESGGSEGEGGPCGPSGAAFPSITAVGIIDPRKPI